MKRGPWLAALALVLVATVHEARAQVRPVPRPEPVRRKDATQAAAPPASSLSGRFALGAAKRLYARGSSEDRVRAIERAGSVRDEAATAWLAGLLEPGSPTRTDAAALRALARALGPRADDENARTALVALVTAAVPGPLLRGPRVAPAGGPGDDATRERGVLAQRTAALALARYGGDRGAAQLAALVRSGGPAAFAAEAALVAYPPARLPFAAGAPVTPELARLLEATADVRAVEVLRGGLSAPAVPARAAALVALAGLGDGGVVEVARAWLSDPDPQLRLAGARALLALGHVDGGRALGALLTGPDTSSGALALAARYPSPALVQELAALARAEEPAIAQRALEALERAGGPDALRALAALAADGPSPFRATLALGRSREEGALARLEDLARAPATRGRAARGYAVARLRGADRVPALERALADDPALRALVDVARDGARLDDALADPRPAARLGAALGAAAHLDARTCARLLEAHAKERDPEVALALAAGLLGGDPDTRLTTPELVGLVESSSPAAYGAALALAARARDAAADGPRLDALLASRDELVRAHAARGLGAAALPDASARLLDLVDDDPSPVVRARALEALRERPAHEAPARRRDVLPTAAALDPDPTVRGLARAALGASTTVRTGGPGEATWIHLRDVTPRPDGAHPRPRAAALVGGDGLARPVVLGEDTVLPGVSGGEARLVLAPALAPGEPPAR